MFSIIKNPEKLVDKVKDSLSEFFSDLDLVVIYGSFANQNVTIESDLDLFIVGNKSRVFVEQIKNAINNCISEVGMSYDLIYVTKEEKKVVLSNPSLSKSVKRGIILWEK